MSRILVVEDEDSFSDALGYLLGREGFDVCVADSGTKAIEELLASNLVQMITSLSHIHQEN
jgi:DNA-binding response OmpR family regulator